MNTNTLAMLGGGGGQINSVDGFVFFSLSELQLFDIFIFEVVFSETYLMTSAENNVLEPPNLKILGGGTARCPYKARAFGTRDNAPPPCYKRPSYGPEVKYGRQQVQPCVENRTYCSFWISSILNLSIRGLFHLKNSCS